MQSVWAALRMPVALFQFDLKLSLALQLSLKRYRSVYINYHRSRSVSILLDVVGDMYSADLVGI